MILADWWLGLWQACEDCSLRQDTPWFGLLAVQAPALVAVLAWLAASRSPMLRAGGAGVVIGGVTASVLQLFVLGWWCTACLSAHLMLTCAVLLCPIGWRRWSRWIALMAIITFAGVFGGYSFSQVNCRLIFEATISAAEKNRLARALTISDSSAADVDSETPIVYDFDWTCARCRTLVPKLLLAARPDIEDGRAILRLRPHRTASELGQVLYDLGLAAAVAGELMPFGHER